MTDNNYTPRDEYANVRRIGQFDEPRPENYLGNQHVIDSMKAHPSAGKKKKVRKERTPLEADEVVNIFRLSMLFSGIIFLGIGVALWLSIALGLVALGFMLWITGMWIIHHADAVPKDKE